MLKCFCRCYRRKGKNHIISSKRGGRGGRSQELFLRGKFSLKSASKAERQKGRKEERQAHKSHKERRKEEGGRNLLSLHLRELRERRRRVGGFEKYPLFSSLPPSSSSGNFLSVFISRDFFFRPARHRQDREEEERDSCLSSLLPHFTFSP